MAAVEELGAAVGQVIVPGDAEYEAARAVWNGMIDRRPAAVARCRGTADVIAAVRHAAREGMLVAVRGGGHNVAGFGTCDGGVVVDLSPMKGIRVDAAAGTAWVQPGCVWADVDRETLAVGRATTGGLVSHTGVAGLTLGGGIGWLMRAFGLTCDNLVSADVVTATGEVVRAAEDGDPELLFGLRGGGGNFGVVTAFELRVHPIDPMIYGGPAFFTLDRAGEALRFWREWTRTLPDELTTMAVVLTAPPEPFVPEAYRGRLVCAIAGCHIGSHAQGEELFAPLLELGPAFHLVGPHPYAGLQGMFDAGAPHGIHAYWKTEYLAALEDGAIDALLGHAAALEGLSPFTQIHLHHVEGAVARVPEEATAFPRRDAPFVLNVVGLWPGDLAAAPHVDFVRACWESLRPYATGAPYVNFLGDEGQDRVRAAYGQAKYERLAALKTRYDPQNLFRLNQNILPG